MPEKKNNEAVLENDPQVHRTDPHNIGREFETLSGFLRNTF